MGYTWSAQSLVQERLKFMVLGFGQVALYKDRVGNHQCHIRGDDNNPYAVAHRIAAK